MGQTGMMHKKTDLLSFDIEISDVFQLGKNEDLEKYAPFHVAVGATAIRNGEERLWYSVGHGKLPTTELTKGRARELLEYLGEMQGLGYMICAWNGLGFDLRWLGHQADDPALAAGIALKSYDPMFQFFNCTGYPVSLAKVAEAMRIPKRKLMSGADAPIEWRAGNHQAVMDYVLGDCQMTNLIVHAIQQSGRIRWVTSKGYVKDIPMPRLKSVEEVIVDPPPDQSWMDSPLLKTKFFSWLTPYR